jgi:hypothetical protein
MAAAGLRTSERLAITPCSMLFRIVGRSSGKIHRYL